MEPSPLFREQLFHGQDTDPGRAQGGQRQIGFLEAEDDRGLATPRGRTEVVHVLNTQAGILDGDEGTSQAARPVVDLDRHDLGHAHDHAGGLEDLLGRLGVANDEAQDAEVGCVRQGHRQKVDAGRGQCLARFAKLTGPILQEERELLDFHLSSSLGRDCNSRREARASPKRSWRPRASEAGSFVRLRHQTLRRSVTRLALPSLRTSERGPTKVIFTRIPKTFSIEASSWCWRASSFRISSEKTSGVTSTLTSIWSRPLSRVRTI